MRFFFPDQIFCGKNINCCVVAWGSSTLAKRFQNVFWSTQIHVFRSILSFQKNWIHVFWIFLNLQKIKTMFFKFFWSAQKMKFIFFGFSKFAKNKIQRFFQRNIGAERLDVLSAPSKSNHINFLKAKQMSKEFSFFESL